MTHTKLALSITVFLWASAFVAIRVGLDTFTPGALALFRFLVASAAMYIMTYRVKRQTSVTFKDACHMMLIGFLGIGVYNICLNVGEMTVSAGVASFIIGQIPAITIITSVILFKEHLPIASWLGLLMSFTGLLLIAFSGHDNNINHGALIIMISSVTGAFYTLSQRQFLKTYHPITVTAWVIYGGTLLLCFFLPDLYHELPMASTKSTMAAIFLGIFPGAVAYLAWGYVLNHMEASKASYSLYALPLVSTCLGFVLLHEVPRLWALIGGMIALTGAFIAKYFHVQVKASGS